jgi:hypothetical protein
VKLDPRSVRFVPPLFAPFGRSPRLVGRQNTVHLQETALVIEGEVLKQTMPLVDSIFRRALAGWTTITVPYSRIVEHRHLKRRVMRALASLLFLIPILPFVAPLFLSRGRDRADALAVAPVGVFVGLTLTGLAWWLLSPLDRLDFRRADGRRVRVFFRIRRRQVREEFTELLERNRAAAAKASRQAAPDGNDAIAPPE